VTLVDSGGGVEEAVVYGGGGGVRLSWFLPEHDIVLTAIINYLVL
jgi:hypothetical protein